MEPRIKIDTEGSSCVAFAEYFPRRETLRLGFVGSDAYEYTGIPAAIIAALQAAESKGRFVNAVIKRFPYRKLV